MIATPLNSFCRNPNSSYHIIFVRLLFRWRMKQLWRAYWFGNFDPFLAFWAEMSTIFVDIITVFETQTRPASIWNECKKNWEIKFLPQLANDHSMTVLTKRSREIYWAHVYIYSDSDPLFWSLSYNMDIKSCRMLALLLAQEADSVGGHWIFFPL